MSTKKTLVNTKGKKFKEGINGMVKKPNVVREAITYPIAKRNNDTVNKTEKSQAYKIEKYKYINNKSEKGKSLDKSRYTQRTEIEDTVK